MSWYQDAELSWYPGCLYQSCHCFWSDIRYWFVLYSISISADVLFAYLLFRDCVSRGFRCLGLCLPWNRSLTAFLIELLVAWSRVLHDGLGLFGLLWWLSRHSGSIFWYSFQVVGFFVLVDAPCHLLRFPCGKHQLFRQCYWDPQSSSLSLLDFLVIWSAHLAYLRSWWSHPARLVVHQVSQQFLWMRYLFKMVHSLPLYSLCFPCCLPLSSGLKLLSYSSSKMTVPLSSVYVQVSFAFPFSDILS